VTALDVRPLRTDHHSLAWGAPIGTTPGTLHVLAVTGGVLVGPKEGRVIHFGRNRPEVHVCIGENDRKVSRQHGTFTHEAGHWWVRTTGRLPVRLPGHRLLSMRDEPIPLQVGYTPLFVRGSNGREHLLEVHVQGAEGEPLTTNHRNETDPPRMWPLSETERLILVVLGQRYLLHDTYPAPLSWRQVVDCLREICPDQEWTIKTVEHTVSRLRARMSRGGVAGLTREEVGEPVGNTLNHNLIRELTESTTLVPPDLRLAGLED